MNCEMCNKAEVTYDTPGKWCDNCWTNWWCKGYSHEQRAEIKPFIFVCRAFRMLGNKAPEAEIMAHVMKACRGTFNPTDVRNSIARHREFQEEKKKS